MVELLYKNILFDLDGTLIDSALGIINSFEYALSKYNISVGKEELSTLIGPPLMDSFMNDLEVKSNNPSGLIVHMKKVIKG
jgi:phosphoglycolate phosphatase